MDQEIDDKEMQILKKMSDDFIKNAQVILKRGESLFPVLFTFNGLSMDEPTIVPIGLNLRNDQEKDMCASLMKFISMKVEAMVLLMDSYVREASPDEYEKPVIQVKGHPDAQEALMVMVYSKKSSWMKHVVYKKNGDNYTFCDMGWDRADGFTGRFESPYANEKGEV